MLAETGSPPHDEKEEARPVSPPLSSRHASRSSTPGLSALDGTPRYLFFAHLTSSPPPPPLRSASPLQDPMAVKHVDPPEDGHAEYYGKVKSVPAQIIEPISSPVELDEDPSSPDIVVDKVPGQVPSLSELSQLLRLERYQSRRSRQVQCQVGQAFAVAARTNRLIHTARSVQRTLAECVKSEDKHSFVNLFNAFNDALADRPELSNGSPEDTGTDNGKAITYPASFVDNLPSSLRTIVLDFLAKLRYDGAFVADRLAALTHKELVALLPEKGLSKSSDSVFGSSPRTSSRTSRHLGFVADGQTELLSSHDFASPLEALIHGVRPISACTLQNDDLATEVWASVCAKLITEQKPGSEKLVPAVIDAWAFSSKWPGKDRLELWLSDVLQNGSFLLEQNRQSFRLRVQGRQDPLAEDDVRVEEFFNQAVDRLLELLGDQTGASVVPEGALRMCQAICSKLQHSPGHLQGFPNFVLTRWLFSSFIIDAITLPEIHGLLTDYFIPESARQRILRDVASRCQKAVFDVTYSWKYGTIVGADAMRLVRSLAERFQSPANDPNATPTRRRSPSTAFVAVSATDFNCMVNALYPPRRPASFASDQLPGQSGLQSSASSVSGFSLFQTIGMPEQGFGPSSTWSPDPIGRTFWEATLTTDQPRETSPAPCVFGTNASLDGERLREACAAIEDSFAARSSSDLDEWCILTAGVDTGLTTVCDVLTTASTEPTSTSGVEATEEGTPSTGAWSSIHTICRDGIEELLADDDPFFQSIISAQDGEEPDQLSDVGSRILRAFDQREKNMKEASDFVGAHAAFRKLRHFQALLDAEDDYKALLAVLGEIKNNKQQTVTKAAAILESCDSLLRSVKPYFDRFTKALQRRTDITDRLRDKMWYVADVRTSGTYDEARSIASALRVMGKPKRPGRSRMAPPLRRWSGPKMSSTNLHLKTESQILELLSAPTDYGGPNKLSDDQSKALALWLGRNAIENFCTGEERLHRLCMEIRRAVDQITADGSAALSSPLFTQERLQAASQVAGQDGTALWGLKGTAGRFNFLNLYVNGTTGIDTASTTSSHALSTRSSRDYLDLRSPTLTNRSSAPFWSPVLTEAQSPSSATSIGSSQTQAASNLLFRKNPDRTRASDQNRIEKLRQHTISLFISDLSNTVFNDGSETDRAYWSGLGGELTEKHLRSLFPSLVDDDKSMHLNGGFDFETAFRTLVRRFSASCNPFVKLARLSDIDTLLGPFMAEQDPITPQSKSNLADHPLPGQQNKRHSTPPVVGIKVDGFRRLFCNSDLRPAAIFRDLQYIAALVPFDTLKSTPKGQAFWNAAVAMSALKQEARNVMIETADSIIAYHSNNRGHGRSPSVAQQERDSATFSAPSRTPSAEDIGRYKMEHAAYLLQIAAKEGVPAAQRELGTLYLTHPELMDHIIAPLSRPRDVFKEELESKWRKNQDPNRCDPTTMCVAHHWMSLSFKGGDALAKEFLRQREEMERLPSG